MFGLVIPPPPQQQKGPKYTAQTVHFWVDFIKETLKNAPNIVGVGHVRLGPRLYPGVWQEFQV